MQWSRKNASPTIKLLSLIMVVILFGGCMNISAGLQPENRDVMEVREASDCVPIILGLASGTATLEGALSEEVRTIASLNSQGKIKSTPQKISKIRHVRLHDFSFLMFGARCVEVVGE